MDDLEEAEAELHEVERAVRRAAGLVAAEAPELGPLVADLERRARRTRLAVSRRRLAGRAVAA
jgi:hypothetical protein